MGLACFGLLAASLAGPVRAQDEPPPPPPSAAAKKAPPPDKAPPGPPPPEEVDRLASDGLSIHATFYPSPVPPTEREARDAVVPIILLHSWKSEGRKEFEALATYLQSEGNAVLVPDLRGHGKSTTFPATGAVLDPARMRNSDVGDMVTKDLEAWRSYLVQQNNEHALNLNKLCLIGSELGASVAMQWALYDWNWVGWSGGKRRASVKAMVLLSPQALFRGLDIREPLANPAVRSKVSVMIIVGKQDAKMYTQANQLYTRLDQFHLQPPGGLDEKAQAAWDADNRDLFFRPLDTKLQGSKLLDVASFRLPERMEVFIQWRLMGAKSKGFPWTEVVKKP